MSLTLTNLRFGHQAETEEPKELARFSARMSWAWAELVVEVKQQSSGSHPFGQGNGRSATLLDGVHHQRSRGQLIEYASEILRRQHRCFVFVISIYGDQARFLRFDRSGVIVSDAFNYRTSTHIMGEFIYRLFKTGTAADRGHDPTAVLASEADTEFFRGLHLPGSSVARNEIELDELERAANRGWPVYRLRITAPFSPLVFASKESSSKQVYARAVRADDMTVTREFLVGRPMFSGRSLISRGTKVFVGYDTEVKIPVVIKDAWRHDRGDDGRTELKTYHELWKDADVDCDPTSPGYVEGIQNLLTPLGGGDVVEGAPLGRGDVVESEGATLGGEDIVEPEGASEIVQRTVKLPEESLRDLYRPPRVHVRLVLKEVCTPLTNVKESFAFVVAIYYALLGWCPVHRDY